ncbi:hypothetical protein AMTR_s00101p00121210 [Amborella trichopoda]|uniref:F-box domain-containing protein n=2 Tax=Amborella trichopoda TaxID=13333 RepID=W1NU36_AMBTC|nr:hypothetical protein AMTR_s00101p00121210 [Amborella trichopoda]
MACKADRCHSKGGFSKLVKSCWPETSPENNRFPAFFEPVRPRNPRNQPENHQTSLENHKIQAFSALPDDIVIECLARLDRSSLKYAMSVCKKWSEIMDSEAYFELRRTLGLVREGAWAFDQALSMAAFCTEPSSPWTQMEPRGSGGLVNGTAVVVTVGRRAVVLGSDGCVLSYDPWSGRVRTCEPMPCKRKRFAACSINGKVYVAGGSGSCAKRVDEYNPLTNKWRAIGELPEPRYGCVGLAIGKCFYVIGGLSLKARPARLGVADESESSRVRVSEEPESSRGNVAEVSESSRVRFLQRSGSSRVSGGRGAGVVYGRGGGCVWEGWGYVNRMDVYDVERREWVGRKAMPAGGCVVSGCVSGGCVYLVVREGVGVALWRWGERGEWGRVGMEFRVEGGARLGCCGVEGRVWVVYGGRVVVVYDTRTGEWRRGLDLPPAWKGPAVCVALRW